MAEEMTLAQEFSALPEALAAAVEDADASGVMPLADCLADTSDCSTDGESCTSDGSCGDTCTDCSDCDDTITPPSFTIYSITQTSAKIRITNPDGFYTRVFVRRADSTTAAINQWTGNGTSQLFDLVGLDPDTTYVVNVAYNTVQSADGASFVGAESFTTEPLPESPSGSRLYVGDAWGAYMPYIYVGGAWTPHRAYIYVNGAWAPH